MGIEDGPAPLPEDYVDHRLRDIRALVTEHFDDCLVIVRLDQEKGHDIIGWMYTDAEWALAKLEQIKEALIKDIRESKGTDQN